MRGLGEEVSCFRFGVGIWVGFERGSNVLRLFFGRKVLGVGGGFLGLRLVFVGGIVGFWF